ncbi:MAG: hypothetical protein JJ850_01445 [Kordiimonadaceae bacterium]|nr:hypothetical protein [Kordiimonadaceae bacterium]MBO6567535.1 hypothetical protein [Kordiimonadaceae bacterium]MBO6963251.1 hypothetical protein [Kordiimonadaceae bacterium]
MSILFRAMLANFILVGAFLLAVGPSFGQMGPSEVTEVETLTLKGEWTHGFPSGAEAQQWVRDHDEVYARTDASAAALKRNAILVSWKITETEVKGYEHPWGNSYRARAVVEVVIGPREIPKSENDGFEGEIDRIFEDAIRAINADLFSKINDIGVQTDALMSFILRLKSVGAASGFWSGAKSVDRYLRRLTAMQDRIKTLKDGLSGIHIHSDSYLQEAVFQIYYEFADLRIHPSPAILGVPEPMRLEYWGVLDGLKRSASAAREWMQPWGPYRSKMTQAWTNALLRGGIPNTSRHRPSKPDTLDQLTSQINGFLKDDLEASNSRQTAGNYAESMSISTSERIRRLRERRNIASQIAAINSAPATAPNTARDSNTKANKPSQITAFSKISPYSGASNDAFLVSPISRAKSKRTYETSIVEDRSKARTDAERILRDATESRKQLVRNSFPSARRYVVVVDELEQTGTKPNPYYKTYWERRRQGGGGGILLGAPPENCLIQTKTTIVSSHNVPIPDSFLERTKSWLKTIEPGKDYYLIPEVDARNLPYRVNETKRSCDAGGWVSDINFATSYRHNAVALESVLSGTEAERLLYLNEEELSWLQD